MKRRQKFTSKREKEEEWNKWVNDIEKRKKDQIEKQLQEEGVHKEKSKKEDKDSKKKEKSDKEKQKKEKKKQEKEEGKFANFK